MVAGLELGVFGAALATLIAQGISAVLSFLIFIHRMRQFLVANMVNLAIRLAVALICAPRFGIAFVWLANFLISYVALRKSWPKILH